MNPVVNSGVNSIEIFRPMACMAFLTCAVCLVLAFYRVRATRTHRLNPEALKDPVRAAQVFKESETISDHFENLFEVPVLFYVACLTLFALGLNDGGTLSLAWIYVALRTIHTLIHCTYNRISHRFSVFLVSTAVLIALWVKIGIKLFFL